MLLAVLLGMAPRPCASAQGQVVDIRQSEAICGVVVEARHSNGPPAEVITRQGHAELRILAPTTVSAKVVKASVCDGKVACSLGRALTAFCSRDVGSRALALVSLCSDTGNLPRLSMHWYVARVAVPLIEGLDAGKRGAFEVDARATPAGIRILGLGARPPWKAALSRHAYMG